MHSTLVSAGLAAGLCLLAVARAGGTEAPIELAVVPQPIVNHAAPSIRMDHSVIETEVVEVLAHVERNVVTVDEKPAVSGRVIDDHDRSVPDVWVVLYGAGEKFSTRTDDLGNYVFPKLPTGRYRAFIDSRKLHDGLLPPFEQHLARAYEPNPSGMKGTRFEVQAGGSLNIDLRVFREASVRGWVSDPSGDSIAGALIRIRSRDGVVLGTRTDENGEYVIEGVYPGSYAWEFGEGLTALSERFDISAGEARVLRSVVAERSTLVRVAQEGAEGFRVTHESREHPEEGLIHLGEFPHAL